MSPTESPPTGIRKITNKFVFVKDNLAHDGRFLQRFEEVKNVKRNYHLLLGLHLFVGIGALAGGLAAILNPQEPLGVSNEILRNSPFQNFLIPGLILFVILGVGNLVSAVTLYRKSSFQGYISNVFSWALIIWIVVQCYMLQTIAFLHVLFFLIGSIKAVLSMAVLFDQRLFPANLLISWRRRGLT